MLQAKKLGLQTPNYLSDTEARNLISAVLELLEIEDQIHKIIEYYTENSVQFQKSPMMSGVIEMSQFETRKESRVITKDSDNSVNMQSISSQPARTGRLKTDRDLEKYPLMTNKVDDIERALEKKQVGLSYMAAHQQLCYKIQQLKELEINTEKLAPFQMIDKLKQIYGILQMFIKKASEQIKGGFVCLTDIINLQRMVWVDDVHNFLMMMEVWGSQI